MALRFTILGSGSRGNAAYLETDQTRLLIDAGFSGKQIRERLATLGRSPESLDAVLLTHEHSDHATGLKMIASKCEVPLYTNRLTLEAVESQAKVRFQSRLFQTGQSFAIGDVEVETFSIPHDAQDPVGFVIHTNDGIVAFLTDLGHATRVVLNRIQHANVLVLETNYDLRLLQEDTRRPWSIKQRILSRHGHLSNEDAAKVVTQVLHDRLRHVYMAHLSQDCNHPDLASKALGASLKTAGASHVQLHATDQTTPAPTLHLQMPAETAP